MTKNEYRFLSALYGAGGVASPFKAVGLPFATREQDKARRNMKKNGLVEYKNREWHLTDAGLDAFVECFNNGGIKSCA